MESPVTFRTLFYPPRGHVYGTRPVDHAMLAYGQDGEAKMGWTGVRERLKALSYTPRPIGNWGGKGTQGYVAVNGGRAILAFRGTEPDDWTDLFRNLNLRPAVEDGEARVHVGFQRALNEVWAEVEESLPPGLPLVICGHSLGGALALLAAARLSARAPDVYTYGAPRVGNGPWGRALLAPGAGRVTRVVNEEDIIASVPSRGLGYAHAPGSALRLSATGAAPDTGDPSVGPLELAAAISELALWVGHRDLSRPIEQPRLAAHSPSRYLARSPV